MEINPNQLSQHQSKDIYTLHEVHTLFSRHFKAIMNLSFSLCFRFSPKSFVLFRFGRVAKNRFVYKNANANAKSVKLFVLILTLLSVFVREREP